VSPIRGDDRIAAIARTQRAGQARRPADRARRSRETALEDGSGVSPSLYHEGGDIVNTAGIDYERRADAGMATRDDNNDIGTDMDVRP
jgi:hypothetical protein